MRKVIAWLIFILQLLISVAFGLSVYKLGMLPQLYMIAMALVLALLCLITVGIMQTRVRIIGKILSLLISAALAYGTFSVYKGSSALNAITSSVGMTTSHYDLIVLNDSSVNDLSDLTNQSIEYCSMSPKSEINTLDKKINDSASITLNKTSNYQDLSKDLYEGNVKAILMDETGRTFAENDYPDFDVETRVIWSYNVQTKAKDVAKNVNVSQEPFTVYISGIDTSGDISTKSRSDVNMLVTVNPKTKKILLSSIPRDYYVKLAAEGAEDKLTHSGLSGPENTVNTVSDFLGIDINYYVRVNFTSLQNVVDALGGVDVNVEESFTSYRGMPFTAGLQTLDGEQALEYARERYAFQEGDNARVRHQQDVLTAIINKASSPAIITNYSKFLDAVDGSFQTNMPSDKIMSLIKMQLNDNAKWDIQQMSFTGHGSMQTGGALMPNVELYYMIPDEESVQENIEAIQNVMNGK